MDAEAIIADLTAEEYAGRAMPPEEQFKLLLAEVKKAAGLRQMAHECAKDAAPYVHPKLAAVEVSGKDGGPINVVLSSRDAAVL